MEIQDQLSDRSILQEIGRRIAQVRVNLNITQDNIAETAGIGKRTVERIENGDSVQFVSIIRVLRALRQTEMLNLILPETIISPLAMVKQRKKERQRASHKRYIKPSNGNQYAANEPTWKWGDEK